MASPAPGWEVIERGGAYGAPLALICLNSIVNRQDVADGDEHNAPQRVHARTAIRCCGGIPPRDDTPHIQHQPKKSSMSSCSGT